VGALVASIFLSIYSNLKRKGLLMTIGQFIFAAVLAAIAVIRNLPIMLTLVCVLGWALVTQLAMMNTLIQLDVPDALRGRVFSTYLWALQGVAPFGSLFIGWLAQTWGVPRAALICGSICLVILAAIHVLAPSVRKKQD
jgi:predicted MFS family arabinose efflux permease